MYRIIKVPARLYDELEAILHGEMDPVVDHFEVFSASFEDGCLVEVKLWEGPSYSMKATFFNPSKHGNWVEENDDNFLHSLEESFDFLWGDVVHSACLLRDGS